MQQFFIVLDQLIGFAVMLVIGFICIKAHVYGQKALDGMCQLILKVGIPTLVFANAVSGTTRDDLVASFAVIVMTVVMYALLIGLFRLLAVVLRLPGERGRIFQGGFIFGNAGFIGLPLALALFPGRGALYFALMSVVDQCLLWTYGVWITKPLANRSSRADERPATSWGQRLLSFVSPALVAVFLALAIIIAGIPVPQQVLSPLHTVGAVSTPLSMIYIGGLFALRDWTPILRKYELYVGIAVKMLAFPIMFYYLFTLVPPMLGLGRIAPDMVHMMTLMSGLPTMSALVMFAERERNMPEYAIGLVLITTLASLFTLTAVSYVVF
ncbi:AEC family transporter [Bifidobacterium simiarum]|uniref:Permease n=1 Tax=Bifidobacterium simiarum TaxID=2045441 RepID=A0A2M9HDU0_9BIFI|nr:AEC family transporter [Bifidobacterium simiarum]PJM74980.1 permease [Bifidobacterium simiarum]